jgi:hypothetical protein
MAADARPLVLFFGCARRGEYEALLEAGLSLGLLQDSPKSGYVPEGLAHLQEVAFRVDADALTARVEAIRGTRSVPCVIALLERHISLAAEVCARLGLSGLAVETAGAVRDKTLMHDRLVARPDPNCTTRYDAVAATENALGFAAGAGYPVVLKPERLHSSMCVTLCRDTDELTAAAAMLQDVVVAASPRTKARTPASHRGIPCGEQPR